MDTKLKFEVGKVYKDPQNSKILYKVLSIISNDRILVFDYTDGTKITWNTHWCNNDIPPSSLELELL